MILAALSLFQMPLALACHGSAGCGEHWAAAGCVEAIAKAHCNVGWGSRAQICRNAVNQYSVQAVAAAFSGNCNIDDDVLESLVRVDGPRSLGCVRAIEKSHCNVGWGSRAQICLNTRSMKAVEAIGATYSNNCYIDDDVLENLVRIKDEFQSGCVTAITSNGCKVGWGSRAQICLEACNLTGVRAVDATFRGNCNIDDDVLASLLR